MKKNINLTRIRVMGDSTPFSPWPEVAFQETLVFKIITKIFTKLFFPSMVISTQWSWSYPLVWSITSPLSWSSTLMDLDDMDLGDTYLVRSISSPARPEHCVLACLLERLHHHTSHLFYEKCAILIVSHETLEKYEHLWFCRTQPDTPAAS